MNTVKLITLTALLSSLSTQVMAENRTPAGMALPISPDYRSVDVDATGGARFVWVQQIEGRDEAGNTRVLFSDLQGALLPLGKLHKAAQLINPAEAINEGTFHELHLTLADNMLSVAAGGMKRNPLPQGVSRHVLLQGNLNISNFAISRNDMLLQGAHQEQLALLKN